MAAVESEINMKVPENKRTDEIKIVIDEGLDSLSYSTI